jgi:cob(I)alamin adenosyltransferase
VIRGLSSLWQIFLIEIMQRGLIQIYTGDGKGKTTAALGLALRAVGAGLKIYIGQFIKKGAFSEIKALRRFYPQITVRQCGNGRFVKGNPCAMDIECARKGLADLVRALTAGKFDLVIADEIFCALKAGLISIKELSALLDKKPASVELVLTGRNAPREIIKRADLVTEMRKRKHPFDKGTGGRKGIEF